MRRTPASPAVAAVVVLAAGQGTRMRSTTPKVLHTLGGRSLLGHVLAAAEPLGAGLRERGHDVEVADRTWSSAQAIVIDPESGLHLGGSDPRSDGAALGYTPKQP